MQVLELIDLGLDQVADFVEGDLALADSDQEWGFRPRKDQRALLVKLDGLVDQPDGVVGALPVDLTRSISRLLDPP